MASYLHSKLFQVLQQMLFAATISLTMPTGDHLETILVRELAITLAALKTSCARLGGSDISLGTLGNIEAVEARQKLLGVVSKIQTTKLLIYRRFCFFMMYKSRRKIKFIQIFAPKGFLVL